MTMLGRRRAAAAAAAAVRSSLPELKAAPRMEKSLTESVSADATNVITFTLVVGLIAQRVVMISSIYLSNMIVRLIMELHKMCRKVPMWLPELRLLVGSVFHSVAKKASMHMLVCCNLMTWQILSV